MVLNNSEVLAMAMDSTAGIEFTSVDNTKYSQEIINGARAAYDLDKLQVLKNQQDRAEFYAEGKQQILSQWHAMQALTVHTDMFLVLFQINIGNILNEIEPTFKKKSDYTSWIRDNFNDKHTRYFQQAKQLAAIGDFARTNAAAGKNRILVLEHIRKVEKRRECEDLFAEHPLPDTTDDEEGKLLKPRIDSVITLHRLKGAGIRFASFDQAAIMASVNNEAITVTKAAEINSWLEQQPENERAALLDRYVQDQMKYPPSHPYTPAPKSSLDKILADLISSYGAGNLEDEAWIARQRELNIMDSLVAAQNLITQLINRIRVEAPAESSTEIHETV